MDGSKKINKEIEHPHKGINLTKTVLNPVRASPIGKKRYNQLYSIFVLVVSLACIDCIKVKKSKYPIHGFSILRQLGKL